MRIIDNFEPSEVENVSQLRFPMMGPSQLADLLLSPLTTDYMPFMMGRMQAAMGYHRFCLKLWLLLIQTNHLTLKF